MRIQDYLPVTIQKEIKNTGIENLEEIRIRLGQRPEYITANSRFYGERKSDYELMEELLNYITDYSWHAYEEQIRQGFITVCGGHRIGITGRCGYEQQVTAMTEIGAVNIRIAHENKGCSKDLVEKIWHLEDSREKIHRSILIVSKPGVGKTTYLRDIIRLLSGTYKIGVVDERSEIAACYRGCPQNDLGESTDVMDNCPKLYGMKMLLRSMSPEIIAIDEIAGTKEWGMVEEILMSGIDIIGTVHANSIEQIKGKPVLDRIIMEGKINYVVIIDKKDGKRLTDIKEVANAFS